MASSGADTQRLVWASTSAKDPTLSPTHYTHRLPLAATINTMPQTTLGALGRGEGPSAPGPDTTPANPSVRTTLSGFTKCGLDAPAVADALQQQGVRAFAADRAHLLHSVRTKTAASATQSGRVGGSQIGDVACSASCVQSNGTSKD